MDHWKFQSHVKFNFLPKKKILFSARPLLSTSGPTAENDLTCASFQIAIRALVTVVHWHGTGMSERCFHAMTLLM